MSIQSPGPTILSSRSSWATASMVFGVLGWTLCPLVASLIAIGLGYAARREMKGSPALGGRRAALAGLILGYSSLVTGSLIVALVALGVYSGAGWTR
jgi:hypothetical protein